MRDFTKYIDSLFKCLENLTFCVGVDISYENNMNVITLTYNYEDNELAYNLIELFKPRNIEFVHKILSPLPKECYTIKTVEKNKPKPRGLDYYVENSGIDIDNIDDNTRELCLFYINNDLNHATFDTNEKNKLV